LSEQIPFCRVCNALEPKTENGDWLAALPEGLYGNDLDASKSQWCSDECMRADPSYKPHESGADLLRTIRQFGSLPGVGVDLVGALARSRGVSREEVTRRLEAAADEVVRGKRGGRKKKQRRS
jgi:hypothetical protein